jgi:hypothetical protein
MNVSAQRLARWSVTAGTVVFLVVIVRLIASAQGAPAGTWLAGPVGRYGLRVALVAAALFGWFWTQSLIGRRGFPEEGGIGDVLHDWSAPLHGYLEARTRVTDNVLIVSSAFIDLFGIFLISSAIFGASLRPFVALLLLFLFRQVCQGLCALPAPKGMIWRHPGFPSLLVTYGVSADFFISGHTAIAVLGAIEAARMFPAWVGAIAVAVAFLEAATVVVLRAHYTIDVLGAIASAWCASDIAGALCGFLQP